MVNSWTKLVQLLMPPACVLCGGPGQAPDIDLCADCAAELPVNKPACERCGEPLAGVIASGVLCGACLRRKPLFSLSHCAFRYAYPVDHLLRALKYEGAIVNGRVLGGLLARSLIATRTTPWPLCVIPVPLAEQRFRERGYNQAIELGRPLVRHLRLPLRPDLVVRERPTMMQVALSRKERRRNVRGAFAVTGRLPGPSVAVLDDVVTTGSTANEVARVLRRAGAKHIEIWAVAHTGH